MAEGVAEALPRRVATLRAPVSPHVEALTIDHAACSHQDGLREAIGGDGLGGVDTVPPNTVL